jgi:hypothetical protein
MYNGGEVLLVNGLCIVGGEYTCGKKRKRNPEFHLEAANQT